jgi:hypothetical protein
MAVLSLDHLHCQVLGLELHLGHGHVEPIRHLLIARKLIFTEKQLSLFIGHLLIDCCNVQYSTVPELILEHGS